jgi:short-subunit dehydrogenase
LVLKLVEQGYQVGAVSRNLAKLEELHARAPDRIIVEQLDVTTIELVQPQIQSLINRLGGLDLFVANAGISIRNPEMALQPHLEVISVNVLGFVASINAAAEYFKRQGRGHIVGISSVAAFWGNKRSMAYNASKAFEITYLKGIRENLRSHNIAVTDIRPGYVFTEMTRENSRMFCAATPEKAATQIYKAIEKKKAVAYITKRWRYLSWLMRLIPQWLYRLVT